MKATTDPRFAHADVPPTVIRGAMNLAYKRGLSLGRLCRGLGFEPDDLNLPDIRVSYRQTSLLIRRIQQALGDPAIGLASGSAQTIVAFGLPGLGMIACRTLGEALEFCAEHQGDAGSLLSRSTFQKDGLLIQEVTPRFFDPDLEPYLIEEDFSSLVAICRSLVGPRFKPARVELSYPKPSYASAYTATFNCPVHFDAPVNRLLCEASWMGCDLPNYDHFTSTSVLAQLKTMMTPRVEQNDLVECVSNYLRTHLEDQQGLDCVARHLNLGERTLRRRLAELNVSYRSLADKVRYERSLDLLKRTSMTLGEVALATGFGDVRNFRRAFKRWAGVLPNQVRLSKRSQGPTGRPGAEKSAPDGRPPAAQVNGQARALEGQFELDHGA